MLYIPTNKLVPGMVLASDLPGSSFTLPLLTKGHVLSEHTISSLEVHGIQGAYVDCEFGDDIVPQEVFKPEVKQKLLTGIKSQFDSFISNNIFSNSAYKNMSKIATDIISNTLSSDTIYLNMIDIRDYDTYTYSHSMFVGLISTLIGIKLGLSTSVLHDLTMAGLLHDIGKLDIPANVINKASALTDEEFALVKKHPKFAITRLKKNPNIDEPVLSGIISHHERYDGSGYPYHLKALSIPLFGRIMALADVYDALTSKRSYRDPWTSSQAIEYMMGCSDTHFDHEILQTFLTVVAAFPVGSLVKLSNGYLGIVTINYPEQTLRPCVRVMEPVSQRGQTMDLAHDTRFLNITVVGNVTTKDKVDYSKLMYIRK